MATTAFLTHPIFRKHQTGWNHPDQRRRLAAITDRLKRSGLWEQLSHPAPQPATLAQITAVHDPVYVERLRLSCEAGGLFEPDEVTVGSPGTYDAAVMSAGAVITAVEEVMTGASSNAFCAVRPPGHHAERDRAMGFCFFNNVAIAARHLQSHHGLKRIAIVDWDVHHGNGTQQAFYADPSVFYFSTHQWPLYPGSGRAGETGVGEGVGTTLNVPLAMGSGDADYQRVFVQELKPALAAFKPDFILISAGFDGHRDDPLAGMALTEAGYGDLTRLVMELTEEHCAGRLVSVLEGGYNLPALAASVEAHVRALTGEPAKAL